MRTLALFLILASPCFSAWAKTYSVAIDRTKCGTSNLTSFPVLISASDTSLKSVANGGSVTSSSGYDIVVATSSSIATYIPWEVEFWDPVNGIIIIWAQAATVNGSSAGSNSTVGVAWGNSAITTQQNTGSYAPSNVWDSNYKAVYHLPNGSILSLADSTSNGNNATNHGATASTGGIVDGAAATSGGNYFSIGGTGFPTGATAFTMSGWFNGSAAGGVGVAMIIGNGGTFTEGAFCGSVFGFGLHGTGCGGSGVTPWNYTPAGAELTSGQWVYIVMTYDGTTQNIYGNGVSGGTSTYTYNITPATGSVMSDGSNYVNGVADEIRISAGIARSADWILSEYNNVVTPGNIGTPGFLIWGGSASSFVRHRVIQ